MDKVKWLLIDIGDVLLLKDENNDLGFNELLVEELGVDIELAREINKVHYTTMEKKYISEADFVADLKKNLGYDAPKDVFSYFARAYEKQKMPNIKFLSFLDEVRAAGIKTAVLSNTIGIYRDVQKQMGVSKENGLDPIFLSWDVEMVKPNKDIFELALKRLGAKPEEVIFIDDKSGHLKGAESVGLKTILFDNTDTVIAKIRKLF